MLSSNYNVRVYRGILVSSNATYPIRIQILFYVGYFVNVLEAFINIRIKIQCS